MTVAVMNGETARKVPVGRRSARVRRAEASTTSPMPQTTDKQAEGVAPARELVQPVEGGDLDGVIAGGEVAAHVEEGGAVVRVERDDAGDAEEQGEEAVTDLEHVGVAAEQCRGDDPEGEAQEDRRAHDVDPALADELQEDPADREAAGDDQRLGVGLHVPPDDEVDPDRQRRAEDHAGQVLADGGDPRAARRSPAGAGPAAPRCPPVPPVPCVKGTAGNSGFLARSIGP